MRYSSAMTQLADGSIDALAVLAEPVRRRLYEHVAGHGEPVDRDGAAAAAGISRSLAAFHLDRLVEAGLLVVEYHRRSGRTGPGAGRPAKFYRRDPARQLEVSLPQRRYGLAAEILADSVERAGSPEVIESVLGSARAAGEQLASSVEPGSHGPGALLEVVAKSGYEPVAGDDGVVRLRNCPFDALVDRHRNLTCSMNLALLESVVAGIADAGMVAEARPGEGFCCVAFRPEARATA